MPAILVKSGRAVSDVLPGARGDYTALPSGISVADIATTVSGYGTGRLARRALTVAGNRVTAIGALPTDHSDFTVASLRYFTAFDRMITLLARLTGLDEVDVETATDGSGNTLSRAVWTKRVYIAPWTRRGLIVRAATLVDQPTSVASWSAFVTRYEAAMNNVQTFHDSATLTTAQWLAGARVLGRRAENLGSNGNVGTLESGGVTYPSGQDSRTWRMRRDIRTARTS